MNLAGYELVSLGCDRKIKLSKELSPKAYPNY